MLKRIFLCTLFIYSSFSIFCQATITSTGDGDFNDPLIWDAGVPTSVDSAIVNHAITMTSTNTVADLIISSGASVTTSAQLSITNLCFIQLGGILTNNFLISIEGDYIINGFHAGNQTIRFGGSGGTIDGGPSSKITNTNTVSFINVDRTILAGATVNFGSSQIRLNDAISIFNHGEVRSRIIRGRSTGETWVNEEGSELRAGQMTPSLSIDASADNNHVLYTNNGTITTQVLRPTTGEYYDLTVQGAGIKRLRGNITVNNDLTIGGTVDFEVERNSIVYDIIIIGDWINSGGELIPSTGNVTFAGTDQVLNGGTNGENFYRLNFFNAGTLTQQNNISVLNDLTLISTYDLNGASLSIGGNLINSGAFTHNNGTVIMNGTSSQLILNSTSFGNLTINGGGNISLISGTFDISGTLSLQGGTLLTNNSLTILSDATSTGRIGTVTGGIITGDVTVQRYFDPVFQGWHQLGVATNSADLTDWDDDFLTTGFTGSDFPSFPFNNVVSYDETVAGHKNNGLNGATNISDGVGIGSGRRVYLDNESMLIESTGTVHTGDFGFPITFTDSGSGSDDGWNLISNPYASGIDWDGAGWSKTAVNDAIYIWDGDLGLYNSYIAGVSTNGGSNIVPSSQAFWIQTNSDSTPALTITESDKSTDNGTYKNLNDMNIFNVYIEDDTNTDQIAIVIRDGANMTFDAKYDAHKFYSDNGIASIASLSEEDLELSINSIPYFTEDVTVPITVFADEGTYVLKTMDDVSIPGTVCVTIEDLSSGENVPFGANQSLSFDWSGSSMISPRFLIHFSAPALLEQTLPSCPNANDGTVSIQGNGTGPWDYSWYDENGDLIQESIASLGPDMLSGISSGIYSVNVQGLNSCGNDLIEFQFIDASQTFIEELTLEPGSCNMTTDGMIELDIQNSNSDIDWNVELKNSNGDLLYADIVSSGQLNFTDLAADLYTLTAMNVCDNISQEYDLNDPDAVVADFIVSNSMINIAMNELLVLTNISQNATSYLWGLGDGSISNSQNLQHAYAEAGNYEVLLQASNNECSNDKAVEIQVIDQSTGISELTENDIIIYLNEHGQIVIEPNSGINGSLIIELRNYLGQIVYSQKIAEIGEYHIIPKIDLQGSIYIISLSQEDKMIFNRKLKL